MCDEADLILVMELAHIDMVADIQPSARSKAFLLAQWLPKKNIPDPFKQSSEMFEAVFLQIEQATNTWTLCLIGLATTAAMQVWPLILIQNLLDFLHIAQRNLTR